MKEISTLITAISILAGLVLTSSCTKVEKQAEESSAVPVEILTVETHAIDQTLEFTGTIDPWKKNNLGAQMPGTIKNIYVEVGDRVKKRDLLVQMDDAQLTQVRVNYELAKLDYQRMKPLLEDGSISPNQFDKVKGGYEAAKAAYELTLANTQIRAPFSGVITKKWMDEGEVFTLMPGAAGSPTILTLMQINPLKILVSVPESDFSRLKKGMAANVRVDILPNRVFHGEIYRSDPAIDPATRTFGIDIKVPNEDKTLRPGMFARVTVHLGKMEIVAVPRAALIRQPGTSQYYCFVVKDSIARRREIARGKTYNELVEIKSGVKPGEQIVLQGQYLLKDGSKVKITEALNITGNLEKEEGAGL